MIENRLERREKRGTEEDEVAAVSAPTVAVPPRGLLEGGIVTDQRAHAAGMLAGDSHPRALRYALLVVVACPAP